MAVTASEQARFREVAGRLVTGVAIVTAAGPDGPTGLTTNAITSVSLDPLLLLVCFDIGSRTLPVVEAAGRFAVNVLADDQAELADVFASKRMPEEKFEGVTHAVADGVPVLDGALAWMACELRQLVPAGDHVIGLGAVTQMEAREDGRPLVFHRGRYVELAD